MTNAAPVDISVDKGTDLAVQIVWTDYFATPFRVSEPMAMEIRTGQGQLVHRLVSGLELANVGSTITYNANEGIIQILISAAVTEALAPGLYYYDLFVNYEDMDAITNTPIPRTTKLLAGKVIVEGRVTQSIS